MTTIHSDTTQGTVTLITDTIVQTRVFMETAGQVVAGSPTAAPPDVAKLRLSLELEELYEKAQAMGLEGTFQRMMRKRIPLDLTSAAVVTSGVQYAENTHKVDLVALLDASADQRVVADGTILAYGLQDVFERAMNEVFRSNMSKFPKTMDEAARTSNSYKSQGVATTWGAHNGFYPVKRFPDGKVLKSIAYSPAQLEPLLAKPLTPHGPQPPLALRP